ncbi:hypothetical protein, partial [Streptomyces mirabilis]|uniref:hypothetical protein n=1 Tax=Streptomyces mirabilis TaxID=68239 RepID=UPI0033A67594
MAVVALDRSMRGGDAVQGGEAVEVMGVDAGADGDGALRVAIAEQGQGDGLRGGQCLPRAGDDGSRHGGVLFFNYTADSGDVATVTDGTTTITRAYDKLGRQVSYKDGTGNTAVTEYDAFDRPVKVTDSAPSTTTYTYDHTLEPRGMATSMTDSVAGTFTAAYDADGNLYNETLPGGTNLTVTRDQTGAVTGRIYRDSSQNLLASDTTEESVHGQVLHDSTTTGGTTDQHYTYDAIGRLTQTDDTRA